MREEKVSQIYFNEATKDIPIMHILYVLSVPLASMFVKWNFKPNTITTLSNLSALLSFYFIVIKFSPILFFIFWVFALSLDMCDGMVSRVTNTSSANGAFYDHVSDLIKIVLLFMSIGIHYNTIDIWVFSFIVAMAYLVYSFLAYMLKYRRCILDMNQESAKSGKNFSNKRPEAGLLRKWFYNNFFLIQGQTVFYLAFVFINVELCYLYFLAIVFYNSLKLVFHILNTNRLIVEIK